MARTPAKEKEKGAGTPAKKKNIWRGLPQLNDDMVGTPTRKGLGFPQIYGVADLISKHERGRKRKLVLHGSLHEWVR